MERSAQTNKTRARVIAFLGILFLWNWCLPVHGQRIRSDRPLPYDNAKGLNYNLFAAAHNGDIRRAEELIRMGADINARFDPEQCLSRHDYGPECWTPLLAVAHSEVAHDPVAVSRFLLDHGADIDAADSEGGTALMEAVYSSARGGEAKWKKLALFLIGRGADVNVKVGPYIDSPADRTPLHEAAIGGDLKLARALVRAGANVNARTKGIDSRTPLMYAFVFRSNNGGNSLIRFLLESGADPNVKDGGGQSLLVSRYEGVQNDHDLVRMLILHGADVNARDPMGNTPLHLALAIGSLGSFPWEETRLRALLAMMHTPPYIKAVKLLIKAGADVNAVNLMDQTPMSLTDGILGREKDQILAILVAAGARPAVPVTTVRLIEMLHISQSEIRSYAAECLGNCGGLEAIETLRVTQSEIRRYAAECLADRGGSEAFDALIQSLADPDPATSSVSALSKIGDKRAVEPLCTYIKVAASAVTHPTANQEDFRFEWEQSAKEACDAIAILAKDDAVPRLSTLLRDENTVDYATEALGKLGNVQAVPELVRLLENTQVSSHTRAKAAKALGTLGSATAVDTLLSTLKGFRAHDTSDLQELRQSIGDSLLLLGDRQTVPVLLELFEDKSLVVRGTAIEVTPQLLAKAHDAEPGAAKPKGKSKPEQSTDDLRERVISALIFHMENDPSFSIRGLATQGLGTLRSQRAVDSLITAMERHSLLPRDTVTTDELFSGGSTYVLVCCIAALGDIGDRRAVPALKKALEHWDQEDYDAVTDALTKAIASLTGKGGGRQE